MIHIFATNAVIRKSLSLTSYNKYIVYKTEAPMMSVSVISSLFQLVLSQLAICGSVASRFLLLIAIGIIVIRLLRERE